MRTDLIDRWHSAHSDRERAYIEEEIWQASSAEERETYRSPHNWRTKLICAFTGTSTYLANMRHDLFRAGSAAEPLWTALAAGKMTFAEAVRVMRQARAEMRPDQSMTEAVNQVIANATIPPPRKQDRTGDDVTRTTFWKEIRALVRTFMEQKLSKLDPPTRDRMRKEFESELSATLSLISGRIHDASKTSHAIGELRKVSLVDLAAACDALGLEMPRRGFCIPPNDLKTQFRRAAKTVHPDVAGGHADGMKVILSAYKTIELYNQQILKDAVLGEEEDYGTSADPLNT